jgi:hypothetical protein
MSPVAVAHGIITACTVVQCSIMDDSAFLWEHAIFGPPPHRNPFADRYEFRTIDNVGEVTRCAKSDSNRFSGVCNPYT